jgi:phosphoserine aminotransferase
MQVPDDYHVLFLAGGASTQFAMVPLNLMGQKAADYVDTGIWSKKAIAEAERYGKVNLAASAKTENGLITIPPQSELRLNPEAAYLHYTPNETIEGVEFNWVPQTGKVPLVADMSSMILSRPVDVGQYGLIYAGAQKNIGQAGITIVIVRNDLLQEPSPRTPTLYSYKVQAENKSFYNTPPTYAWYIAGLTLAWMKRQGGVAHFAALNQRKASKLYAVIDAHKDFYINKVNPSCRSQMNVSFDLPSQELIDQFLTMAAEAGMTNLKGHRLAGGVRASIYNAMPEAGVDMLVAFMKEFVRVQG